MHSMPFVLFFPFLLFQFKLSLLFSLALFIADLFTLCFQFLMLCGKRLLASAIRNIRTGGISAHKESAIFLRVKAGRGPRLSQRSRQPGRYLQKVQNFFGLLKSELLYLQEFQSMEHFKQELIEYLDYYNNCRIKAKLKGLPPAIHRLQALSAV